MASATPVQQHLVSSALRSIPSSCSPSSAGSCIIPRSNWGSATLAKPCAVRRVGILRAATGSEVIAPNPVEDGPNLPCDACTGKGWLVCDFCKGQKTNVQVRANKFYRRCPSCRAVGVVICPQCKVFKCVTFPDGVDGY